MSVQKHHLKILVVGPKECGKSAIANFVSDTAEKPSIEYQPTCGARILEFDLPNTTYNGKELKIEVELWDVSGDRKYESCWPAILHETVGVIFVYNPDKPTHAVELEAWFKQFATSINLRDNQSIVFAHRKPGSNDRGVRENVQLGPAFSNIQTISTNIDDQPDRVKQEFIKFVTYLSSMLAGRKDDD